MNLFMDVGAHDGQTLRPALEWRPKFDLVFCFEPVADCATRCRDAADRDPRAVVYPFGLWNRSTLAPVYGAGTKGGSLWPKDNLAADAKVVTGRFERASSWMKSNVSLADRLWLKLNCEGAECDILEDLLDSGEFSKVSFLLVCWDAMKIEAQRHRVADVVPRLPLDTCRVMYGSEITASTHHERITKWLSMTGPE